MKFLSWLFRLFVIGCLAIITTLGIYYFQLKSGIPTSTDEQWRNYGFPFPIYHDWVEKGLSGQLPIINAIADCAFYSFLYLGVYLIYLRARRKDLRNSDDNLVDN